MQNLALVATVPNCICRDVKAGASHELLPLASQVAHSAPFRWKNVTHAQYLRRLPEGGWLNDYQFRQVDMSELAASAAAEDQVMSLEDVEKWGWNADVTLAAQVNLATAAKADRHLPVKQFSAYTLFK